MESTYPTPQLRTRQRSVQTQAADRKLSPEAIAGAISVLPKRLQTVLALLFQHECTPEEIASILSVSESRVREMRAEAMRILRRECAHQKHQLD